MEVLVMTTKLYFAPSACSLAPHIALIECGVDYQLEKVNLKTKQTKSGQDFMKINPKGGVPVLELENGELISECAVILQVIAYQNPKANLMPTAGSAEHLKLLEWLNTIATEYHKGYTPLFAGQRWMKTPEGLKELKDATLSSLDVKIKIIDQVLTNQDYLMGDKVSLADFYLYNVLSWSKYVDIKLSDYSNVNGYMERMMKRPAVVEAMTKEGLL
jgi:glutathione S-transferase